MKQIQRSISKQGCSRRVFATLAIASFTVLLLLQGGRVALAQTYTVVASLIQGSAPAGPLVQGLDGQLYGTTNSGGNYACNNGIGCGTIFKLTTAGVITNLFTFCSQGSCADGALPVGAMVLATDGNLYGTAAFGGLHNLGVIFKITPSGLYSAVHSFSGSDGSYPATTLIQIDGALYSTMVHFGGNIFELSKDNVITSLFDSSCDPVAGLFQGTDGKLYGTTAIGGLNNTGTVFSIDLSLTPFVTTLPTSRKIGTNIAILGTNLTGASSVTFNGTPATFRVVSATQITATIPSGATTGSVVVVTPSATLTSNLPFRVM